MAAESSSGGSTNHEENNDGGDRIDVVTWVRKHLEGAHLDLLREMLGCFANSLMAAEVRSMCGADYAERSTERVNSSNGYRRLVWDTHAGTISLALPRLRHGSYFPAWLPKRSKSRRRAERAIVHVIAEAYLAGVSTRMVDGLVRALSIEGISESQVSQMAKSLDRQVAAFRNRPLDAGPYSYVWIDGLTQRRLEHGRIVNVVTAIASGVSANGNKELLGLDVFTAEDGAAWTDFLRDLVARGLSGVRLVVADSHPGLKAAIAELLPGAVWQRSRVHALRDLLTAVAKPAQTLVAILINSIYAQPNATAVWAQHARIVEELHERFPEAAVLLTETGPDMLAFTGFPKEHWRQVWSNNPRESLNGLNSVSIRHHLPNFFVLAPGQRSIRRHASNGVAGGGKHDREGKAKAQALAVAPKLPVSVGTRFNTLAGRLPTNWLTTNLASAIDTLANALPGRLILRRRHPATVGAIRIPAWLETVAVIMGLTAAFAAHAINIFNFPRYDLDEGTYMSSAWAILNDQLTAYPYGYGHPPFGWMQIAAWIRLTGGFSTFGNAINSGRVLMLFYALGSSCLVYLIAHRMSGRRTIGLLAMTLFSFSPLSLVYQRQVFLDNIGVFWLLLSLYLIVAGKSRLSYIVGAGLSFGFALLSKETFVILVPVMIYALWLHTTKYQRLFGLITFTYTVVGLGSAFVLMAFLKGELFPYAWHLPWDHHPHLSLLDTLATQVQRSQSGGNFSDSWYTWTHGDSLLIVLSIVATIFNLIVGLWKRNQLFLALSAVSYWALLLRGGVVFTFYIIVLVPLVALNAALAVDTIMNWIRRLVRVELACTLLVVSITGSIMVNDLSHADIAFTQHPTSAQTQSMVWIRNHVAHNAVVVINSYLYMDLRQPGGEGVGDGATYPYAHVYWNIAYDPELHDGLLQNNWDRIDYIVADSGMLYDIAMVGGPMLLIATALHHSFLRQEFRADQNDKQIVISIYQVIHKQPPPLGMYGTPRSATLDSTT